MIRLLRWRWQIRALVCVLNIVHVFVHGTMFDQGALDATIAQLDLMAGTL